MTSVGDIFQDHMDSSRQKELNQLGQHNKVVNDFMLGLKDLFQSFIGKTVFKTYTCMSKDFKEALSQLVAKHTSDEYKITCVLSRQYGCSEDMIGHHPPFARTVFKAVLDIKVKSAIDKSEYEVRTNAYTKFKGEGKQHPDLAGQGWIDEELLLQGIPKELKDFRLSEGLYLKDERTVRQKLEALSEMEARIRNLRHQLSSRSYRRFFPERLWRDRWQQLTDQHEGYANESVEEFESKMDEFTADLKKLITDLKAS